MIVLPRRLRSRSDEPALTSDWFSDALKNSDEFLSLIGSAPLELVTDLAQLLADSAKDAGASAVAEIAAPVHEIASAGNAVALTGAIRDLTEAMDRLNSKISG